MGFKRYMMHFVVFNCVNIHGGYTGNSQILMNSDVFVSVG